MIIYETFWTPDAYLLIFFDFFPHTFVLLLLFLLKTTIIESYSLKIFIKIMIISWNESMSLYCLTWAPILILVLM